MTWGTMTKLAGVVIAFGLVVGSGIAASQETPPDPAEEPKPEAEAPKPWAEGVSPAKQDRARALLAEGNDHFVASRHREALKSYEAALAQWDHPKIRYNITRTLIYLDRPLGALENVEAALRHGEAGLETFYSDALTFKRTLENQVSTLEVRCSQAGVNVTVDGQSFLRCPGSRSIRVLPGRHQVVGKKPGFLTATEDLVLTAGVAEPVDIKLVTFDEAAVTVRRWDSWKPWAVVGGGAVVGGIGILLELQARSSRNEYAELLADNCSETPCESDFARGTFNRARLEHGLAVSAMIVGGAAVVAGLAGVILNRPRKEILDQPEGPQVVPTLTGDTAGVSITGRF